MERILTALSASHKLAMADAIVYATAELHDADILTLDARFKDLERTVYFEKA
ncbi:PIN domain-containing protein [Rhizobium sp. SEMIA 4085]|uniref:PIN domain-containing protein n=1 Tax=Rhizobium sp. SEMIA 4085 TaxID=2137761 RepID=UPI000587DE8C|nr:PIN domain-containing protein [Rhizobium gallicum]NNH32416.1 PIN domain-containing protein [Rhizobium sp. SEMIA 4085]